MKYSIDHTTRYNYAQPVALCHNLAHLRPRDTAWQSCLSHRMWVEPAAAAVSERTDFFGNQQAWFAIQEPHKSLTVRATSVVHVTPVELDLYAAAIPWEQICSRVRLATDPITLDALQFTFASPYVPRLAELADYARPSFVPGRPMWEAALDLTRRIHEEFAFDPTATDVGTPVLEVLHNRRGVCQDFAHFQIGCLRSLGLAARYVSGYLVTRPPPGEARLAGADVSHAWISVYCPGHAWIDYDPTNGLMPAGRHITLGWGRDYDDLSPVRGVILGGQGHALSVSVDVWPTGQ